jgi:propionate catabolism operon transcriptional regulator
MAMRVKAIGIAPYEGLKRLMEELAKEDPEMDLVVEQGDLKEGVDIARRAEKEGYELIISRGGTASLIREAVSIPVAEIPVSGYDMLRVLTLLKDYRGEVAIVGFPNITRGAAVICDLLNLSVRTVTVRRPSEVEDQLESLRGLGIQVVVGDVVTVKAAEKLGMHGLLITSGKEAVLDAFEEGKRVYRLFSRLRREAALYRNILDRDRRGIVVFDEKKRILFQNPAAARFPLSAPAVERAIQDLVEETLRRGQSEFRLLPVEESCVQITAVPLDDRSRETWVAIHLEECRFAISPEKWGCVEIRHTRAEPKETAFHRFVGKSGALREAIQSAQKYSEMDVPVWISGEEGTGKEMFALAIHQASSRGDHPFIAVDSGCLKLEEWNELLADAIAGPLRRGTLYLKNAEQIPVKVQKRLGVLIADEGDGPRWLISTTRDLGKEVRRGDFDRNLYQLLGRAHLPLPPLRERKEDIDDLIPLFIAESNSKYGKSIVGMESEVIEELKRLTWPGNIEELKRAVEAMVLRSDGHYIGRHETADILERLKQEASRPAGRELDWTGTLEEMELQIIQRVLVEEGMNQTRAAQRLGINRSTLWRKLQSIHRETPPGNKR